MKALAADDPAARRAIVDLLLAEPGRAQDSWLGALSLGRWAEATDDPLAQYLVGRNLTQHDQWRRAAPLLDRALAGAPPTARIAREALRQRAIGACVLREQGVLDRLKGELSSPGSPFAEGAEGARSGRKDTLLRLIGRCEER